MENEKRFIDANALESHFHETKMIEIFPYWKELSFKTQSELLRFGKALKEMMQNAPTVDAVEVVRGRWECENESWGAIRCSNCNGKALLEKLNGELLYVFSNYCPNCGAKMDGGN